MNKLLFTLGLWLCSFLVHAANFDHSVWDALLKKHVVVIGEGHATQVNYPGFIADKTPLNDYLMRTSAISKAEFDQWTKSTQLAFLINGRFKREVHNKLSGESRQLILH